jgi:quinoprotein glucose dehydrogenase
MRRLKHPHTIGLVLALGLVLSGAWLVRAAQSGGPPPAAVRGNVPGEWRYWGADAWSTRYSPLDQINATNFNQLQVAWQFNAGLLGGEPGEYYRTTPLFANGRLFTVATLRRTALALNPATGEQLWKWEPEEGIRYQKAVRQFAGRGLAYWTDGREERVIIVTPGYHLALLDAKTGKPDPKFGKEGVVDLMDGLGFPLVPIAVDDDLPFRISDTQPYRKAKPGETWDPVKKAGADGTVGIDPDQGQIAASSPAIVVNDVIIVGNSSIHGYYPTKLHNLPGFIRGFDIHTGKQLWKFNLIPQAGEFGADTWTNGSKWGTEGVGKNDAWAPYSADPELGLVYIPVGMPLMDEYGGHRPGNNLFGTSLIAIDVKTGKRKWHFQLVHHDIWDYDCPMSPNLMDVTVNGRPRKIVAQTTKQGWIYAFDRATGEPIWPMPELGVLQSDVPGEQTSATQPIPSKPAPYAQQGLLESDLIDYTPEIKAAALALAKQCRMGPYFIPGSATDGSSALKCSWYAPGAAGGVNIDSGAAVDPETGMIYVGSQSGLSTITLQKDPCSEFRYSSVHDSCGQQGALPPPPGYVAPAVGGRGARGGGGGAGAGAGAGGGGGAAAGGAAAAAAGFQTRGGNSTLGMGGGGGGAAAVSIAKVKEMGGITAYNMNTGDKSWWIPDGGYDPAPVPTARDANGQVVPDPLFAGVTLPLKPARGLAEVITTKTLVVYGTGRSGGPAAAPPQLYAVDKATGKQVGAVQIPARTSAVPMTYLYQGKQYIVFATTSQQGSTTSLVALTLPGGGK